MIKTINQQGFAHVVGLGLAVVVIAGISFTGYAVMNSQKDKKQLNSSDQVADVKEALPVSLAGLMEISLVKELAVQSSTATVIGLELENDNGVLVYEILLSDGTVIVLNAKTGERIKTSVGPVISDDNDGDSLPANFTVKTTFEQARATAQALFPAGTINKIELDVENSVVVISVRFADKARVDVDATTGTVVRTKSPKGVDTKPVKTDSKENEDSSASLKQSNEAESVERADAPDADEDRDIEAADDDGPDAPDAPDAPDTVNESDSSGSDSGSGGSDSGSSGRRG